MHIMIATDGHLDAGKATEMVTNIGGRGTVTVLTVVEVPRKMLNDMREAATHSVQDAANTVRLVEANANPIQTGNTSPTGWIGDDAAIAQYIHSRTITATGALTEALDAAGVAHEVVAIEAEDPAQAIIDEATKRSVDVIAIGTRGLGRFEGLLGSISTKVARRAGCSVLLVR